MSEFQIPRRDELRSTWLRGYRKSDVEVALAQFGLTVEQQRHELDSLRRRSEDQERELHDLRNRLDAIRGKEVELVRQLEELSTRRTELEQAAEARARTVLVDAEEGASRLRTDALIRVGELQRQAEELLALRHNLVGTLKGAMDDIAELARRLATGGPTRERSRDDAVAPTPPERSAAEFSAAEHSAAEFSSRPAQSPPAPSPTAQSPAHDQLRHEEPSPAGEFGLGHEGTLVDDLGPWHPETSA